MSYIARTAAIALIIALGAARTTAATVYLSAPPSVISGQDVTVDVCLSEDLTSVYALQAGFTFDPAVLTLKPGQETTAAQGFYAGTPGNVFTGETIPKDADLFRLNTSLSGQVILGYVKNPGDPASSTYKQIPATAVKLVFATPADYVGQTTLNLASYTVNGLSLSAVILGARDGAAVETTVGPSLVVNIVSPRIPGDANADGVVTQDDVLLILRTAGGIPEPSGPTFNFGNADVWPVESPDQHITLADATRVQRYLVGMESTLN